MKKILRTVFSLFKIPIYIILFPVAFVFAVIGWCYDEYNVYKFKKHLAISLDSIGIKCPSNWWTDENKVF